MIPSNRGSKTQGRTWTALLVVAVIIGSFPLPPAFAEEEWGPGIQLSRQWDTAAWTTYGGGLAILMTEADPFPAEFWCLWDEDQDQYTLQFKWDDPSYVVGDAVPAPKSAIDPDAARVDYGGNTSLVAVWSEDGEIYFNHCANSANQDYNPLASGCWDSTVPVEEDPDRIALNPAVAVSRELPGDDHAQYVHVVWWSGPSPGRIYYARGRFTAGHTFLGFSDPLLLSPLAQDASWPAIAAYKGTVVVLYTLIGSWTSIQGLQSAANGDSGTWTSIGGITSPGGSDAFLPDIAVDEDGRFHAVWNDTRTSGRNEVYYACKNPGETTWQNVMRLSGIANSKSQSPSIATQVDTVYVVWEDYQYDLPEVMATRSVNRGDDWDAKVLLSKEDDSAKALVPEVACQDTGENVAVVWVSVETSGLLGAEQGNAYYSRRPWHPCTALCPSPLDEGFGGGLGTWSVVGTGGSSAGIDSTDGYQSAPSLMVAGVSAAGAFAGGGSADVSMNFDEPYTLIFRLKYLGFYRSYVDFGHVRLSLWSPSSEILFYPGSGSYVPLGSGYRLDDFLPPGAWGRFEVDVNPGANQYTVSVNGFPLGTASYLPSLVPSARFGLHDEPIVGSYLTAWLDDVRVYGTGAAYSEAVSDCDLADWTVSVGSPGVDLFQPDPAIFHAASCGLRMDSRGTGFAYGQSPPLELDATRDYKLDFWFRLTDLNNHWFRVMDDGLVLLVIDYSGDLKTWDGATAQLLTTLNPAQWYHLQCAVHPSLGTYDVYVGGVLRGSASFFSTHRGRLLLGDPTAGSYDRGAAHWDDIAVLGHREVPTTVPPQVAAGSARIMQTRNEPNPFRGETEIRYSLPETGPVRLEVFDVSGRRVAILVDGIREAGVHAVRWTSGGAPPGVYFTRLVQGATSASWKMILDR